MVSQELKDLRKQAKKLKVEFDAETTEAELKILVDAAEAAKTAQEQKAGEVVADTIGGEVAQVTPVVSESVVKDEAPVEGAKEQLIQTFVNRQKEAFQLVQTKEGKIVLKKHTTGAVLAVFKTVDEGKHHLENLSRF